MEDGQVRINLWLSRAGICSRREADRLIAGGRVTIDGKPAQAGMKVDASSSVCLDGKPVDGRQESELLLFYKPRGVVCTTDRRWGDVTVDDVLKYPVRVFSVGRLDKESEGLLLMTNEGDILNKILKAGNVHEKEYIVTIDRPVPPEMPAALSAGVFLEELGVRTLPCRVRRTGERELRIVLTQGLNRQIRRMCAVFGCRVTKLVRIRIMNFRLGDLKAGEYRKATGQERERLKELLKDSHN